MQRILRLYFLIFLLAPLSVAAQDASRVKDVLVITTHSESSAWARDMLRPVSEYGANHSDVRITQFFLKITSINDVQELESKTFSILDSYTITPDLVFIMGGSGYQLAYIVNDRWNGIPIILAGENQYFCESSYAIYGKADPNALRHPVSDMLNDGLNVTLIHAPSMIERTVDLMFTLQPQMHKLFFIGGENFSSREQQVRLEKYLLEKYPSIIYKPVLSNECTTDDLLNLLDDEVYPWTGVLFSSWLSHEDYLETIYSRNNIVQILETVAPIYTTYRLDYSTPYHTIAYYSYDYGRYCRYVNNRLVDVLERGRQPRRLPFVHLEIGTPHISWHAMTMFELDHKLIPRDAKVYDMPESLWKAHKPEIMWALFFLLVGFGLFIFLTMRKSIKSLRKANDIAEKSSQMRIAFVQNISHEIRTPLNAIIGFSQLLCVPDSYTSDEERLEYMEYVMNNSQLLTVIINDLLFLSKLDSGQVKVIEAPWNLNEVARMAIKSVENKIPEGVTLIREPGIPEDMLIITDGMRVQQVLVNLLTNACKYTEYGTITIGSSMYENPGFITFYVEDTGPGVPKSKANEIFERFAKLDSNKQGAGLGLTISRLIVSSLSGKIWLDTRYTGGARFVFTIPFSEG